MSVFVVLGLIWAAVLLPPVFRARAERREKFIDSFREQMGALDNRKARATEIDRRRKVDKVDKVKVRRKTSPAQRRRDILGGMLGALMGSLVLGMFPSLRMVWVLHLFLLNLFLGYVALLAHQRNVAMRRGRGARVGRVRAERKPAPRVALTPALEPTS